MKFRPGIEEVCRTFDISPQFAAELDRRIAEDDAHPERGIPWEVVDAEAAARDEDDQPLTEAEERHLDLVLALDAADPTGGRSWEEVEADMIAREERESALQ